MKKLVWLISIFLLLSCSTQSKLTRQYVGKDVAVLQRDFGKPIYTQSKGESEILQFEKVKVVRATVIDEGRPTLDPIISPESSKILRYTFTVKDDIITNVTYTEAYRD